MQPQVKSFLTTFSSLLRKPLFDLRMSFRYERIRNGLEPKVSKNEELLSSFFEKAQKDGECHPFEACRHFVYTLTRQYSLSGFFVPQALKRQVRTDVLRHDLYKEV